MENLNILREYLGLLVCNILTKKSILDRNLKIQIKKGDKQSGQCFQNPILAMLAYVAQ